jgi:hypothetical protein
MADIPRLRVVNLSLSMETSSQVVYSLKPRIARRSCAIAAGPCVWWGRLCGPRASCGDGCVGPVCLVGLAVWAPFCGGWLCAPRASGCAGSVCHPITKSPGRSRLPRPPHLHPTTKPASALQTFMTRLLPPIPNNQLPNTLPTLMAPSTMGGVRSKRSKFTQGNCKAWRSHDAHKALSAHVKFSTKATTENTTHQRCVNAVQARIAEPNNCATGCTPKAAPPQQEVYLLWGLGNRLVESLVATQNQKLGPSWPPLAGCIIRGHLSRRLLMTLRPHIGRQMSKIPLHPRPAD